MDVGGRQWSIVAEIKRLEDGSLYLHSRDIPGLHLWGRDLKTLQHDAPIAIRDLLHHNRGIDGLEIEFVPSIAEAAERLQERGTQPISYPLPVTYLATRKAA